MEKMTPELKPGCCHKCGHPISTNPHPDAGKPDRYLEVGCPTECIPCTVLSRHQWAVRAQKAERELRELREQLAAPAFKVCPECMGRGQRDIAHGVTKPCERCDGKGVITAQN